MVSGNNKAGQSKMPLRTPLYCEIDGRPSKRQRRGVTPQEKKGPLLKINHETCCVEYLCEVMEGS